MRFENPLALLLLVPLIFFTVGPCARSLRWWLAMRRASKQTSTRQVMEPAARASLPRFGLLYSHVPVLLQAGLGASVWRVAVTPVLLWMSLGCFILALARPQYGRSQSVEQASGIDVMLVLDVSGSMQALDFKLDSKPVDRLTMLRKLAAEFVSKRPADRIGLVVFGSQAFSLSPLTLDHEMLQGFLSGLEIGMGGDGTAIGDALGVAVRRLSALQAKSRVAVLLTDGANNAGTLDPRLAAQIAAEKGVKVYSVAIGGDGPVDIAVPGFFGESRLVKQRIPVDFVLLQDVARTTGGLAFRAESTEELRSIYANINALEKTEVKVRKWTQYTERMEVFVVPGVLLILLYAVSQVYAGTRRLE